MKNHLFFIFFLISHIVVGQNNFNKVDSLKIDYLLKKANSFIPKNKDSTVFYYNKIIRYSDTISYAQGLFIGYNLMANFYYNNNKYEEALVNTKKSYAIAKSLKNERLQGKSENLLSFIYLRLNDYDNATLFSDKALQTGLKLNEIEIISNAYLVKGNMHYTKFENNKALSYYHKIDSICTRKEDYNSALIKSLENAGNLILRSYSVQDTSYISVGESYFIKARDVAKSINNRLEENYAISQLGKIYWQRGDFKTAISYFKTSLDYFEKNNDIKEISDTYWSLGIAYNQLKDVEKAMYYVKKRITLYENTANKMALAKAYTTLAGFQYYNKEYKKAILNYQIGLKMLDSLDYKSLGNMLAYNYELSESFAHQNNYKKAFTFLDKAFTLQDSLNNNKQNELTLELEKKYQTQKKEHQIVLLKTENELTKQQEINQRNLFITGISITSFAGLFFFFLYKNRQKTTRKLRELDQLKSNLFANISHEFRTPLTLISSPIQQQLKKKSISNKDKNSFEIIQRNTNRLLDLVNQLLDISKIEAGSLKLKVALYNLPSFYGKLLDGFSFIANQKEIDFKVKINSITDETWFDKDVLEKISTNLLSNAIKYTPIKGTIITEVFVKENKLNFIVKNTGEGIASNQISKIFDRFYQLNNHSEGTGIGLALVKELVLLHKGKITVESTPKQWTTFTVLIPIHKKTFKANEIITEPLINKNAKILNLDNSSYVEFQNPTINEETENPIALIVEDNEDVNNYISTLLKDEYTIIKAVNGEQGISQALKYVPDIIISDIMMPVKDGIELCNTLKTDELTNHIPIILLTAKAGEENQITGIKAGADIYITKPFNDDFLLLNIKQLIAIRKKLQKRYSQEVILKPADIAISSIDESFLNQVQLILDSKLIESSFHIDEFSKAVGMSRMQLHRKLKALTGLSTSEFIRSQRLKLAAQLLKTSDINISQVGYSVGFNDHAYFSKCFKEMYKCSPSEYAKK